MAAIAKSYGVLMEGQFEWLIRKGDLVISGQKTKINWSKSFWEPASSCVNGKCDFPIYSYRARTADDDGVPSRWLDGQHGTLLFIGCIAGN